MRLSPLLALLPAFAAAQGQIPLGEQVRDWFGKAKSYIPSGEPAAPVEKVADKIADKTVTSLNLSNWQSVLEPSSQPQDWFVFVTGGNKTCFGRCEKAEKAFNESVLLFAADRTSPNLGYLNCEDEKILCSIWAAGPPSVWHLHLPQAQDEEPRPTTPLHIVNLNTTTVTPEYIYKVHSEKTYKNEAPYDGVLHPFDGLLAQYGLNVPLGYAMYGFSVVPSWLFMIAISFFSRSIMGRRMANPGATAGRPQQTGGQ